MAGHRFSNSTAACPYDENSLPQLGNAELSRIGPEPRNPVANPLCTRNEHIEQRTIPWMSDTRDVLKEETIGAALLYESQELPHERSALIGPGGDNRRRTIANLAPSAAPSEGGIQPRIGPVGCLGEGLAGRASDQNQRVSPSEPRRASQICPRELCDVCLEHNARVMLGVCPQRRARGGVQIDHEPNLSPGS